MVESYAFDRFVCRAAVLLDRSVIYDDRFFGVHARVRSNPVEER